MNKTRRLFTILTKISIVLLVLAGLIFLTYAGLITLLTKGRPGATFSSNTAKKIGVFSCQYEILPDSILLTNGDFIKFEEAWGERYWSEGGYFEPVDLSPMRGGINYRIYIKMNNVADTAFDFCKKYQAMVVGSDSSTYNLLRVGSSSELMWEYHVKYLDERVLKIYLVKTDIFLYSKINIETLPQLADTFFTLTMK